MTLIELREMCSTIIKNTRVYSSSPKAIYDISQEARNEQVKLIQAIQLPEQEQVNSTVNDSLTVAALEKQVSELTAKNAKLQEKALSAEKCRGIASAKFGDGRTVQQIMKLFIAV